MSTNTLQGKRVVIVVHENTSGFIYDLRDYILDHGAEEVLYISHPLLFLGRKRALASFCEYYRGGKRVETISVPTRAWPEMVSYVKDVIYTIRWCLRFGPFDYYIGVNNLNAVTGLMLRVLGRVRSVIYYAVDYIPHRFPNALINGFYHQIERVAAYYATATWNFSPRMITARNRRWDTTFPHQTVVPHGVSTKTITRVPFSRVHKYEVLYMGTLLEKQGIQHMIDALPIIANDVPKVTLTIIGHGPYESALRKRAQDLRVKARVKFLGYINDHQEMQNRVAKSALAIALYDRTRDTFTRFTDPGKVKSYVGAGVPVLITDVPHVARELVEAECGIMVDGSIEDLARVVSSFLSNTAMQKTYRKNAVAFAKQYEWNRVFGRAFSFVSSRM